MLNCSISEETRFSCDLLKQRVADYYRALPESNGAELPIHNLRYNIHEHPVSDLNCFEDGAVVDTNAILAAGLLKKTLDGVKILGNGELKAKLEVEANAFSKSAEEAIKAAGGNTTII